MKYSKEEKQEARKYLEKMLKPGDTVYTDLRHVSQSGMSRNIDIYIIRDNKPICLSWYVARLSGHNCADDGSIKVSGCGMDMGFHLVYNLGYALFPNGYECTGENCQSNDHFNGDYNHEPHHHNDGGYAFYHRWL